MVAYTRRILSGRLFWGWILGLNSLWRATSYTFRPPEQQDAKFIVEVFVPYSVWAALLYLAGGLVIITATVDGWKPAAIAGHVVAIFCYGTFFASVVGAAVFLGYPWAGGGLLAINALLHGARLMLIAERRQDGR